MFENKVVPLRQKDEIDDPLTCRRRQRVVRHGYDPVRPIQTALGRSRWKSPSCGIAVDCMEGKRAGASIASLVDSAKSRSSKRQPRAMNFASIGNKGRICLAVRIVSVC